MANGIRINRSTYLGTNKTDHDSRSPLEVKHQTPSHFLGSLLVVTNHNLWRHLSNPEFMDSKTNVKIPLHDNISD